MPEKLMKCTPEGNEDDRMRYLIMSISYPLLPDPVKDKTGHKEQVSLNVQDDIPGYLKNKRGRPAGAF